jgi:hypothetical protein
MLRLRSWRDAARIRREMCGYPSYRPPFAKEAGQLTIEEGEQNFAYFLAHKYDRLGSLKQLLATFGVSLSFDDAGIREVGAWFHRFGGHLIHPDRYQSAIAYRSFVLEWTGAHRGLNVIWDLGIFAGEFIIRLNPACEWTLDDGDGSQSSPESYLRPHLRIARRPGICDVLAIPFETARAKRKLVTLGRPVGWDPNLPEDAFENTLRHYAAPDPVQAIRTY